jgi:hypothetical protein
MLGAVGERCIQDEGTRQRVLDSIQVIMQE